MEIRASDKKLIAALVITAGAGIALTFSSRRDRKGRVLHPAKIDPRQTAATVNSLRNSYPIHVANAGVIPHHGLRKAMAPVSAITPVQQILGTPADVPDVPPRPAACPPASHPAPALQPAASPLTITQSIAALGMDAFIVLLASCLFLGVPQIFGVSVPLDPFGLFILTCSIFLIAMLYVFLVMLDGRGTPGQAWMRLRLSRPFGGAPAQLGDLRRVSSPCN
jgi:hypothetical protein